MEIPSYRFYNVALYSLKENKEPEHVALIDQALKEADFQPAPIDLMKSLFKTKPSKTRTVRREESKKQYVPSWWRGEDANAKIAMNMMQTLPKG